MIVCLPCSVGLFSSVIRHKIDIDKNTRQVTNDKEEGIHASCLMMSQLWKIRAWGPAE
jgi:hypothetical protein